MKTRLQTSLGQHLVMTPQLRQAIKLLQMSSTELELEIASAVESNPLLDWAENAAAEAGSDAGSDAQVRADGTDTEAPPSHADERDDWTPSEQEWGASSNGSSFDDDEAGDAAERVAETETLADHLLWQLHLSHLSPRDRSIGAALIDALEEDGYLRESLAGIAQTLLPGLRVDEAEVLTVLHQVQCFDPVGVGARSLGECLQLQLNALPPETPGLAIAGTIAAGPLERLPRSGVTGIAQELKQPLADVETAVALLRSLDPRPGTQIAPLEQDTYVVPDAVVWRQNGVWRAALASHAGPKVVIHRGYEQMIRRCGEADAGYLRAQLQEARWLLKGLQARGETLLRVVRCLLLQQAGFLEFGEQALRPLTLRDVASELGLHESTISRAIARKHVRTPRGTLALRAFFASGIDTESGGEASSTAIQSMLRRMIDEENPRKPLSDAKLAEMLKTGGIPVARRTVAKYREGMNIPASHERVRIA